MSNSTDRLDGADGGIALRRARPEEVRRCLALVLSSPAGDAGDEQVVDFLRYTMERGISLTGIWLIERSGQVAWAILPVTSPGRTLVVYAPYSVPPTLMDEHAPALIERSLAEFRDTVHLAQVLIEPGNVAVQRVFVRAGFTPLGELSYMLRELHRNEPAPPLREGLDWVSYSPATHALFARTILASYERSLDCPALAGMRDIEDIIIGHKACGRFDPALWFCLCDRGIGVGVALLAQSAHQASVELVYLGLAESHRGQGLGGVLLHHALHVSQRAGSKQVTLAVDSANKPAVGLYQRHGFARVHTRLALMRDLRRALPERSRQERLSTGIG